MTSSLVGSEMCIRDSSMAVPTPRHRVPVSARISQAGQNDTWFGLSALPQCWKWKGLEVVNVD
eukprot:3084542-Prorocentrum_lima.AAC.1